MRGSGLDLLVSKYPQERLWKQGSFDKSDSKFVGAKASGAAFCVTSYVCHLSSSSRNKKNITSTSSAMIIISILEKTNSSNLIQYTSRIQTAYDLELVLLLYLLVFSSSLNLQIKCSMLQRCNERKNASKQILSAHAALKKEQDLYIKKKSAGGQKSYKRPGSAIVDTGQPIMDEDTSYIPTIDENASTPQQVYKYIIQCLVLYNSWPLTESQQMFVQALKDLEKNDNKAHGEKHEELITLGSPDSHTISEGQKSSGTSKATRKGKEKSSEKEKTAKEKQAPRFEPQAAQARLHYLSQFIRKTPDAECVPVSESQIKAGEEGPRSRSPTILEMSPQLIRKKLECVDLNQYIRKTNIEPLLQTDELTQQQAMQKAEEVHQFRQYRNRLHSIRDIKQEERFKVKDKVLEMYGEMRKVII
ncbi:hypothetical protein E5288_WYG009797 [Bos mutus]|uniref:Androglobin domain-containing protein n=1 Tax=Bos mutus TaxID=72004 RepID=A0A6B0R4U7_9CETA|nr:hypothetical protein [Bos mutus]